ncbi:Tn3 family transposase [Facilibium subflavum]|uniref:Tn3 family transposase n=1 Tax=Facilibium subflavum TaxID=2219058 RepID=UPI000E65B500|nr:Tn3 family transposase [Facilibium subflavum]
MGETCSFWVEKGSLEHNINTLPSTIIKKLSSYSRKNKTLKALIEFDRIIMSIYMLRYIDDLQLRRNVHRALNRGEAFHQIRSALFQVNGKKILGKSENALEISNQCNRVLACCIIYYNASLLSELLTQAEARGDEKLCKQIKRLSPVAWQHISLLGNFVFCENAQNLDIKGIVESVLAKFD